MATSSAAPSWITPSRKRWTFPTTRWTNSGPWPQLTAEDLVIVREPLRPTASDWRRDAPSRVAALVRGGLLGPESPEWTPPSWLLHHQVSAARRVAGSLAVFGGALLADAVGLGKTYVALAVATRYRQVVAAVPSALRSQWGRAADQCGIPVKLVSHESLSRNSRLPRADLVIVDEAHRFRNRQTRRYDRLGRDVGAAHVLCLTATPVVNRARDLLSLLGLFLPDDGFALLGVRSLADSEVRRAHSAVAWAAAAATVARSHAVLASDEHMPSTHDLRVLRPPPVSDSVLPRLLHALDGLELPSVADTAAAELLRLHLFHRLASSAAALEETLRRHLAYLDRAVTWAERGEALPRADARRLFGPGDDLQFELGLVTRPTTRVADADDSTLVRFRRERERVRALLERVRAAAAGPSPKLRTLVRFLSSRSERKTLVFTTARATAFAIAQSLEWGGVAVVTGGDARIASGPIALETALGLFAPLARGRRAEVPRTVLVQTLVATDFASEGLDLQDADAVVHYDLPWTPLTLAQRLGRVVRLGAQHNEASVVWFAPPRPLDERISVTRRVAAKVFSQLALAVPMTSSVGRASIMNSSTSAGERLARRAERPASGSTMPSFAVVAAPAAAVVAISWRLPGGEVPHVIAVEPPKYQSIHDIRRVEVLIRRLERSPASDAAPPAAALEAVFGLVRRRLRLASLGPVDPASRQLRRRVLRLARTASTARDVRLVDALDHVLECSMTGLRAGQSRELAAVLKAPLRVRTIERWVRRQRCSEARPEPGVRITAVLVGDGSAK